MATTKLNNGQLPTTLSSKTIDNTNDINTTTTRLKITGGSNGQVLSTDGSGNLSWTTAGALGAPTAVITKTTDETVTSSTTLQNDDELQYALTSGKSYYIQLLLMVSRANTTATNQLKYGFAGNSNGSITIGAQVVSADGTTPNSILTLSLGASVPIGIVFNVTIKATANFTGIFKFAQGTSNTTGVTIMAGSRMEIYEVA